jgi:hypothetical protein
VKFLKQSTQVVIPMGPFLDKADGLALKTDATTITDIDHATTGIFLIKNGGTGAIRHQGIAAASVADAYGMMLVTLDATDTGTLGRLRVCFAKAATYLPVWEDFQVLPPTMFDSLVTGSGGAIPAAVAGTVSGLVLNDASNAYTPKQVYDKVSGLTFTAAGKVDANALAVSGTTQTARDLGLALPAAAPGANGGLPTTNGTKVSQTVDLTAAQSIACSDKTGFSLASTGADLILKSSTFVQAVVAAIDEFATRGLAAIYTLLVTTGIKAASIPSATIGGYAANQDPATLLLVTPANKLATDAANCVKVPDTQKVDVNTIKTKGVTVDAGGTTFPAVVGTSTYAGGAVASVTSYGTLVADVATAVWGAATRTLSAFAFTVAATVASIPDSAGVTTLVGQLTGITLLAKWLRGLFRKDAMDATAKTEVNAGGGTYDETTDSNQAIRDTEPLGTAMRGTDSALLAANYTAPPSVGAVADQVWDEILSGHAGAGSAGLALATASSGGVDPSVLADALWDEAMSGHQTTGSAGKALADANNGTPPTAIAIRTEMDSNSTRLSSIDGKTTNLPSDPADESLIIAAADAIMTRIGAAGAGLTALGDARLANLDATISSRTKPADTQARVTLVDTCTTNTDMRGTNSALLASGYTAPPSAATIATTVRDVDNQTPAALSLGAAVNSATAPTTAQVADKMLGRNLAGGSDGGRTVGDSLRFLRNKVVINPATNAITIYKEDDVTVAWTGVLTTTAGALPITGVDPA